MPMTHLGIRSPVASISINQKKLKLTLICRNSSNCALQKAQADSSTKEPSLCLILIKVPVKNTNHF